MVTPRMTLIVQLVLHALLAEPGREMYGLEIVKGAALPSGTVYPVLARLEKAGWIGSRDEKIDPHAEGRPPRRYYRLTADGESEARAAMARASTQLAALGIAHDALAGARAAGSEARLHELPSGPAPAPVVTPVEPPPRKAAKRAAPAKFRPPARAVPAAEPEVPAAPVEPVAKPVRTVRKRCPHPGTRTIGGRCNTCETVVLSGGLLPDDWSPPHPGWPQARRGEAS